LVLEILTIGVFGFWSCGKETLVPEIENSNNLLRGMEHSAFVFHYLRCCTDKGIDDKELVFGE